MPVDERVVVKDKEYTIMKTISGTVVRQDPIRGNQGAGGDKHANHQLKQNQRCYPLPCAKPWV